MWPECSRERQAGGEIDPRVKTLVDRMNGTGAIKTVASCQGHPCGGKPPYVYFLADVQVAAAIERRLRDIAIRDDSLLHFMWVVEANFNEKCDLAFRLYSPEQHRRADSLLNLTPLWYLNRKRLDADLLALAWVVEETVLLNIREKSKPEIA